MVRRVVANMAVSAFRTKAAEARAVLRLAGQRREGLTDLEPEDHEFWNQVRSLPAQQAKAVTLFYLDDLPVTEIADVLNCSPATAKVHLFRGRQALAAKLGVSDGD